MWYLKRIKIEVKKGMSKTRIIGIGFINKEISIKVKYFYKAKHIESALCFIS